MPLSKWSKGYWRPLAFLLLLTAVGWTEELKAQCTAAFTYSGNACQGQSLSFLSLDTTKNLKYHWDFGDIRSGPDNIDSTAAPSHLFTRSGKYTVTLIVRSKSGCTDTVATDITVFSRPVSGFSWNNACAGINTSFTDLSSAASGDTLVQWSWNFGNSTGSTLKNPVTSYNPVGSYSVRLLVITKAGCRDSITRTVVVFKKPGGKSDVRSACRNAQVNFTADTISTARSYRWDFGDSSFFNARTASHVYKKTGWIYPNITVDFGTTRCTVPTDSILIHALPDATFSVPADTQCFNGNQVCVKPLRSGSGLKSRMVIFDDGSFDDSTSLSSPAICHQYTDIKGGKYRITMELTDSNNCVGTYTATTPVLIYPQVKAGFTNPGGNGCFTTKTTLVNTSSPVPPLVSKFRWDFGDSTSDSSTWTNLSHTYTKDGVFNIKLMVEDQYGCTDTFTDVNGVRNTSFDLDPVIDSSYSRCRSDNIYVFKQTPVSGGSIRWDFIAPDSSINFTAPYHFRDAGRFFVRVAVTKNGCRKSQVLGPVNVYGPQARFGAIQNRFQCNIKDTVYYNNASILYRNKSALVFWDAGDMYASPCTTITKTGTNTGKNCNYSRDSLQFKHMYARGKENCYYTKLVVVDTILGCRDSTYAATPLMPPKAKGLFYANSSLPCPGSEPFKTIWFDPNIPQPTCLKYAWWVLWDSAEAVRSGNFNANWRFNEYYHNYPYVPYAGDSKGYITTGLIVENGLDSNGKVCRDTGWFHNVLRIVRLNPMFGSTYDPGKYYCPGSSFRFFPVDSAQSTGLRFVWNFGDGTRIDTTWQGSVFHTYTKAGKYRVRLSLLDSGGCRGDTSIYLNIGVYKSFWVSKSSLCTMDTLRILQYNHYYDTIYGVPDFWSDPIRTKAGKEEVRYNLGDGNGYQDLGPNPLVKYPNPGNYLISMAVKDSTGCWDTLSNWWGVGVSGAFARFKLDPDTLTCGQTIDLRSLSSTTDSSIMKGMAGDNIRSWEWTFGNKYPRSFLPNPRRFFATGTYSIQLKVSSSLGCLDSVSHGLQINGPFAAFDFKGDTTGCAPLFITFTNKSRFAGSYTWLFNDVLSGSFGTNADTAISYSYGGYGPYYPQLIARGTFIKNGIPQSCEDIYPDTSTSLKRTVFVYEQPKPDFTWVTNCASLTTSYTNTSTINTDSIVWYQWDFGDGRTSNLSNPVVTYADTGTYRVVLYARSSRGCEDSIVHSVVVSIPPTARFVFTTVCKGSPTRFTDSSLSYNDRIYRWRWNFGDGTRSTLQNPGRVYAYDTFYKVNLIITNVAGCSDSITRTVQVLSNPVAGFGFQNVCDRSIMAFTNRSSSKVPLASWSWDFGDSSQSSTWTPGHVFPRPGTYPVKWRLTTTSGCSDSLIQNVTVHPNPQAVINKTLVDPCFKYHILSLKDSSTILSGTTTSRWTLGNGDSSQSNPLNYRYVGFGRYSLRLISVSGFNCRDTTYDSVEVYPSPSVSYSVNQTDQCLRYNQYSFTDNSSLAKGTYTRLWQFGDGTTGNSDPGLHSYLDTGIFRPALILTTDRGCKDTAVSSVRLWPMPVSGFTINDTDQCLSGNLFIFTSQSRSLKGPLQATWNFGDGTTHSGRDTSHTYAVPGTYTIRLVETGLLGCRDTIQQQVIVRPMPVAAFRIADSLQCLAGNRFDFSNTSRISAGTLTSTWRFGDGQSSKLDNPQHSYTTYGTYTVWLRMTSGSGCNDSISSALEIYPMPQARIMTTDTAACIHTQSMVFTDSSRIAFGSLSRIWNFGDSTTSGGSPVGKTFKTYRTYLVELKSVSAMGCRDSAYRNIHIRPKPMPRFTVNDSMQCLGGNSFVFTDQSTIGSGSYTNTWQFGDGGSQTGKNATHQYMAPGTYPVTLWSLSNYNCRDSVIRNMVVHPMPVAGFSVNQNEQCLRGNVFRFTNLGTILSGTITHKWSFGDKSTSDSANPLHSYLKPGTFRVLVKTNSAFGCLDSAFQFMIVDPMPEVHLVINDSTQCLKTQNFIFTDTSRILTGLMTRRWSFPDGSTSTLKSPSKTFALDSVLPVILTETSDRGCSDSVKRMIEVYSHPQVQYTVNDSDQCLRQNSFVFTNGSTIRKGSLSYSWDFGNKTGSVTTSPTQRYLSSGTFVVQLKATSDQGCLDSASRVMRVDPMPVSAFQVNDTGQCIGDQNFIFTNKSGISLGTLQYLWRFGDGSVSNLKDPSHRYAKDSVYAVILTGISDRGCRDSVQAIMDVYPGPKVRITIDDSLQCLRGNVFGLASASTIKYGSLTGSWNFGDGGSQTGTSVSHSYSGPGIYRVVLKATSDLGCVDSNYRMVNVGAMPAVQFRINDPGQCFRTQNFQFTNQSTISIGTQTSLWRFGDGVSSTLTNTGHIYSDTGYYFPELTMISNYGCRDSLKYRIRVNPAGRPSFTFNDSSQCVNAQNFVLTNTGTVFPGRLSGQRWDFGNGQTAVTPVAKPVYSLAGIYRVMLETTTDSGCIDSTFKWLRVFPKPNPWFSINDSSQCLYTNRFDFTDISFDSMGIAGQFWNLGNVTTANGPTATVSFTGTGFWPILLRVNSVNGCTDSVIRQVFVKPMPDPSFAKLADWYCIQTGPYALVPVVPGGSFLGKNVSGNSYDPQILWEDTVMYRVTVNGCTDSSMQITTVYPGPDASLGNDTILCKYESIELTVNSWSSKYRWNDGSDRSTLRVIKPGIYWVVVTNACGVDGDTAEVAYYPVNCRLFLPNAFSPNGDGENDRFKPVVYGVDEMYYEIFNRWGELLYRGDVNDDGWDGTYNGEPVQEDAYLVTVHYSYTSGARLIKPEERGTVILIR